MGIKIRSKKISLRTKLSVSYIVIVFICILLISIFVNYFVVKSFKEYIEKNHETKNMEITKLLAKQFDTDKVNITTIETIGISALESGKIIKVYDVKKNILWDATRHNDGECNRIIEKMSVNLNSLYPHYEGNYYEEAYDIINSNQVFGKVMIGSYGPYYLSENDIFFMKTINNIIILIGFVSLIISLIIGSYMAKNISKPILEVVNTVKFVSKGMFNNKILHKPQTREIQELISSVNDLARILEKEENLRKQLTGDVAHELRTPLTTLQSHMEAMIDGIWKPEKSRLLSCHDEIVRLKNMVYDLEKLAKYEEGNIILNKKEFDIYLLVKSLVINFQGDLSVKNIILKVIGKKTIFYGDKEKISQIIINILSNSIKYSDDSGEIEVHIKDKNEEYIELSFIDNGAGIPESDIPYIFERFYRVDKSRNRLSGGTGIGLTIVKKIVELHEGQIFVKSILNKGTHINVLFKTMKE